MPSVDPDLIWAAYLPALAVLLKVMLPIAFAPVIPAVMIGLIGHNALQTLGIFALASFTVALSALVVGYLAGASRETVAGDVLPVVMAGLGSLAVYGVVQKSIPLHLACGLAITVSVFLLAGMLLGATFREYGGPQFQTLQPVRAGDEVQG
jgi:hypothetical protein